MKVADTFMSLHILLTAGALVNAFDPFTTTVGVSLLAALGRTVYKYFHESCDKKWIGFNSTGEHAESGFKCTRSQKIDTLINKLVFLNQININTTI